MSEENGGGSSQVVFSVFVSMSNNQSSLQYHG